MKKNQVNYTLEELKKKILDYDEAAKVAYEVRDGNLYMMYKELRDTFLERYSEKLRHAKS